MLLDEIKGVIEGQILVDFPVDRAAWSACGSDLISDVLRFVKARTLLLTGLTTLQMVRTAELLDLAALVFVRGKRPSPEVVALATRLDIPVMYTELSLYEACGRLYAIGLPGCSQTNSQGIETG